MRILYSRDCQGHLDREGWTKDPTPPKEQQQQNARTLWKGALSRGGIRLTFPVILRFFFFFEE